MRAMISTNGDGWKVLLVPENEVERQALDRAMNGINGPRQGYAKLDAAVNKQLGGSVGITLINTESVRVAEVRRDFKMDAANDDTGSGSER